MISGPSSRHDSLEEPKSLGSMQPRPFSVGFRSTAWMFGLPASWFYHLDIIRDDPLDNVRNDLNETKRSCTYTSSHTLFHSSPSSNESVSRCRVWEMPLERAPMPLIGSMEPCHLKRITCTYSVSNASNYLKEQTTPNSIKETPEYLFRGL